MHFNSNKLLWLLASFATTFFPAEIFITKIKIKVIHQNMISRRVIDTDFHPVVWCYDCDNQIRKFPGVKAEER